MSKATRAEMREKRANAQDRVDQEKARNAHQPISTGPGSKLVFGKYFFIVESEEGYEIYRATDILSTLTPAGEGMETPAPVHVCEKAVDAAVLMGALDRMIEDVEGEDAVGFRWPSEQAQPEQTVSTVEPITN